MGAALLGACGGNGDGLHTATTVTTAVPTTAGPPSNEELNRRQVEQFVLDTQRTSTPELKVANPSCPQRLDLVPGASFECTVEVEGVKAPYTVSIPAAGSIQATPAKAIISTAKGVEFIRANLPPAAASAVVSCGSEAVRLVDVGAALSCTISDGAGTQTVKLVAKDTKGAVSLEP